MNNDVIATATDEKEYPLTRAELSEIIDKVATLFERKLVQIPPHDCTVYFESKYSDEEIFQEHQNPEIDIDYVDGEQIIDKEFPKRDKNRQIGEHLSLRSRSVESFRILDVRDLLTDIYTGSDEKLLVQIVAIIREYNIRMVGKLSGNDAAQAPWLELLDASIGWLSLLGKEDIDIYDELCGVPGEEIIDPGDNWLSTSVNEQLIYQQRPYSLSSRQWEIIFALKKHVAPCNGLKASQIKNYINTTAEARGGKTIDGQFAVQYYFKNKNADLLGKLIIADQGKPARYFLSRTLA